MTQVDLGDPLPLSLTLPDEASGLFPRCLVYDESDVLVSTRDLTEVGSTGRYTDTGFTPLTEETFVGLFIVFTNSGHTTKSAFHGNEEQTFRVDARTYQAKIRLIDDGNTEDRYSVVWFRDAEPLLTGVTVPTLQVFNAADGVDLVASTAMAAVGATGTFRFDEATNRIDDGATYFAIATATIDGATRTWLEQVGRDSA